MSKDVTVRVIGDTTDIDAKIAATQAKVDEVTTYWGMTRDQILTGINSVFMSLNYMVSAVRIGVRMVGRTLKPVEQASLTMIQGAVSSALAIAGMFSATGILAGVGMALMLVTAEMSVIASAKVIADIAASEERLTALDVQLTRLLNTGFIGEINVG